MGHTTVFTAHFANVKAESVWFFMPGSFPELTLIPTFYLYLPEPLTRSPEWVAAQLLEAIYLSQDGDNSSAQHYLFIYPNMDFKGSLQSFDFENSQPQNTK